MNIVIPNTARGADVSDIVDVKFTLYQPISSLVLIYFLCLDFLDTRIELISLRKTLRYYLMIEAFVACILKSFINEILFLLSEYVCCRRYTYFSYLQRT